MRSDNTISYDTLSIPHRATFLDLLDIMDNKYHGQSFRTNIFSSDKPTGSSYTIFYRNYRNSGNLATNSLARPLTQIYSTKNLEPLTDEVCYGDCWILKVDSNDFPMDANIDEFVVDFNKHFRSKSSSVYLVLNKVGDKYLITKRRNACCAI